MKRVFFVLLLVFLLNPVFSQNLAIDRAIDDYINNLLPNIPHDKGVAIISFETNRRELMLYFLDTMAEKILNKDRRIRIYERHRLENLQNELNFSLTGAVSDDTAQRIGHFVGVGTIIYGSMNKEGDSYRMAIRAANVETGQILFLKSYYLQIDQRLRNLLGISAPPQTTTLAPEPIQTPPTHQSPSNPRNYSGIMPQEYFEFGYVFSLGFPIGFRIGSHGFYTTWNFAIPNFQGHGKIYGEFYNENGEFFGYLSEKYPYIDLGDRTKTGFEWVVGFSINVIDNVLKIPIGIGGHHSKEWRLYKQVIIDEFIDWVAPDGSHGKTNEFLAEIGVAVNTGKWISFLATYRLIGFKESGFTTGVSLTVPNNIW
jgi:TolB-like protein